MYASLENRQSMARTAAGWNFIYRSEYGRRYPCESLIVFVQRLKARGFNGRRALDVGFGTVADMLMLVEAGYDIDGLEVAENAIAKARAALDKAGVPHKLSLWEPGTPFPCESGFYDLVVSIGALHYNLDQRLVLSEMRRVLRTGGRFMTTYHGPLFHHWRHSEIVRPGVRRYTAEYPNESTRGVEFVYFERVEELEALYNASFVDVEVSHYQYRVLGQDESYWLVTGTAG